MLTGHHPGKFDAEPVLSGGSGAGPGFDGASMAQAHMTNSRLTAPEVLEWRYPVPLESYAIRAGSGGLGRWNGGNGGERRIRFLEPMTASILANNRSVAPFGLAGGEPGDLGRQWVWVSQYPFFSWLTNVPTGDGWCCRMGFHADI